MGMVDSPLPTTPTSFTIFTPPPSHRTWLPKTLAVSIFMLLLIALPLTPAPAQVYLEDSPDAAQLAREAAAQQTQGHLGQAAALLHRLSTDFGNRLMEREPNHYTQATRWVRQQLILNPPLRQAYRKRFDATAIHAWQAAHDSPNPQAALANVARQFGATGPGRDATLDLAARQVRMGNGHAAALLLADIADLPEFIALTPDHTPRHTPSDAQAAQRYHQLSAWTAALQNDSARRDAAVDQWAATASDTAVNTLRQALAAPTPHTSEPAHSVPAATPSGRPLWHTTLAAPTPDSDDLDDRYNGPMPSQTTGELHGIAHDGLLLANDGSHVYALDGVSGRLQWSVSLKKLAAFELSPLAPDPRQNNRGFNANRYGLGTSPRSVTAHNHQAFAVLGPVHTANTPPLSNLLVCLDTQTGIAQWIARPSDVDATVAKALFHGTPQLTDDLVIIAARHSHPASFQDSYLVAFDRHSGVVRWRRHLSSTTAANSQQYADTKSLTTFTVHPPSGRVYACDNLGAAAALDLHTGSVHWLTVLPNGTQEGPTTITPLAPGLAPQPCHAGLLLPIRFTNTFGLLLDITSGKPLASPAVNLIELTDLRPLPNGDLLAGFADGRIQRLNSQTLAPHWTLPSTHTSRRHIAIPLAYANKNALWITDVNGSLAIVDAATGTLRETQRLDNPGIPLPVSGGLVTLAHRSFASYTPWSQAYALLQQRIAQNPHDPQIGLSMATLALNAAANTPTPSSPTSTAPKITPHAAVVQGVKHCLAALESAPAPQRIAPLNALLTLAEQASVLDASTRDTLFDQLAQAVRSPAELLNYTLARAVASAKAGQADQAVDLYQTIISRDTLAAERVSRQGVTRRGGVVAHQALQTLLTQHGAALYATHDRSAATELDLLVHRPSTTTDDLLQLAKHYPFSNAAANALLQAGRRQAASPTPAAAATTLRRSYRLAQAPAQRAAAAGALAEHYIAQNRPLAAIAWLTQISRDEPTLEPLHQGTPTPPTLWVADLNNLQPTHTATSHVTLPLGASITHPGIPIAHPTHQDSADTPGPPPTPPHVLLSGPQPGTLAFIDLAQPNTPRWTLTNAAPDTTQIHLSGDTAVLWSAQRQAITVRSLTDGHPLFPSAPTEPLLAELGEGGQLVAARHALAGATLQHIQNDFEHGLDEHNHRRRELATKRQAPPHVVVGEAAIAVVDKLGRAAAIDRHTGAALWHLQLPLESITFVRARGELLLIGGLRGAGTGAESGVILILDLATGQHRQPQLEDAGTPRWADVDASGNLLVLRHTQLTLYNHSSNTVRWRADLDHELGPASLMSITPQALYVSDATHIFSIDLEQGVVHPIAKVLPQGTLRYARGTGCITHHPLTGLTALAPDGSIAWRSALNLSQQSSMGLALSPTQALIATASNHPNKPLSLITLDLITGRFTGHQHTSLPARFAKTKNKLTLLNGALLIEDRHKQTFFLPSATPAPQPTPPAP